MIKGPTPGFRASTLGTFAACLLVGVFGLTGCDDGSDGAAGPPGPEGPQGPAGPAGPPGGGGIATAGEINITDQQVAIPDGGGAPVVSFKLTDASGLGLVGLTANQARFTIAQLSPGTDGSSSEWQSYITRDDGGVTDVQATAERASDGTFVDNGDGTYQYTFSQALTDYPAGPTFDATKTHRISMQLSTDPLPTSNGSYDFVPAGGDVTFTRLIVDNDTCNACHDQLAFHGGGRFDVEYCVTCHNPYSIDGNTGNSVDMKWMVHKIHAGAELEYGYTVVGHNDTLYDFSEIEFSQDIRNCETCHEEDDADTPQASNWRQVANRASCGSCHDNVALLDGSGWAAGNHPFGLVLNDDSRCLECHAEGTDLNASVVHLVPTIEEGKKFAFNILDVTGTAPGETPSVTFSVTDPTNADAPYDIANDPPFTQGGGASRMSIDIGWDTDDYTNTGSGFNPALPIQLNPLGGNATDNGDGTFTMTSATAIPLDATGTAGVGIEGHPAVDVNNDGTADRIPVTNVIDYAPITDATAQERRVVVDIEKCDDCHAQLSIHGNNRTDNVQVCVMCHNPNATDAGVRGAGAADQVNCSAGSDDVAIDMKYMIHAIHASGAIGVPFDVCGFGGRGQSLEFVYPGKLNNCEGCHVVGEDTFYPVDSGDVLPTTVDTGADITTPVDDLVTSPNASVCASCHRDAAAAAHMELNGAVFETTREADGTATNEAESCAVCHGPGRSVDVKEAHGVGEFRFN